MFDLLHYTETDSTNREAGRLIKAKEINQPTALYADRQTAGQGSRGRDWSSNRDGNILVSYIMPVDQNWPDKNYLALYAISLAVCRFIKDLLPDEQQKVLLKWPNDLLLNEEKLGGMLHETVHEKHGSYFIAGIGLNIAWHPEKTDNFPAISLSEYLTDIPSIATLIEKLGTFITEEIQLWQNEEFETYKKRILPLFYRFGEKINIYPNRDREKKLLGVFKDINNDGALVLETDEGLKTITAGDIFPHLT